MDIGTAAHESSGDGSTSTAGGTNAGDAAQICGEAHSKATCGAAIADPDKVYTCQWTPVRELVATDACVPGAPAFRCLAFEAFVPGPPNCPVLAGCENPSEDPDVAIRPAVRNLGGDSFDVVDTCGGNGPVGLVPPFELCKTSDLQPSSACSCACGV